MGFQVPFGKTRLMALSLIVVGLFMSQLAKSVAGLALTWTAFWVLLMTFTTAISGVANEKAVKRNYMLDLNVQNSIMYSIATVLSYILIALYEPRKLLSIGAFLHGFSMNTLVAVCLQAF